MIPFFDAERQSSIWKHELKQAYRSVRELLTALSLSPEHVPEVVTESDFPLLVPRPFVARMTPGDPMDPLLRQVLPVSAEYQKVAGFVADPLAEHGQPTPWLHKYRSRVLLTLTGGCAVNCRYCFRRHFPYHAHRMGEVDWQKLADLLHRHPEINEIILSGGEPLLVEDAQLAEIAAWIGQQPSIKRWRIHTRMPVVIPARITSELCKVVSNTKPCVVVLHINHPNEIDASLCEHLQPLRKAGVWLLNQSVLLKGINDAADTLCALSERLFDAGVVPYYLHCLDKVDGAAHFDVPVSTARRLAADLHERLPGFLVPRLVVEAPGEASKVPVDLRLFPKLAKK